MRTNLTGAALALVTSLTGSVLAAPADGVDCEWRITASHVLAELEGDNSTRAKRIRQALVSEGADKADFVPESCAGTGSGAGGTDNQDQDSSGSGSGSGSDTGREPGSGTGSETVDQGATAAEAFNWGEPDVVDNFDDLDGGWNFYDGPGHAGNGTRSPDAASVSDGILTIKGTGDGTTGGMAWSGNSQKYGRWEGRVKAPKGSPSYNALLLLWPTAEDFPVGGEIDFMEIMSQERDEVNIFLHYGADNSQVQGKVEVDATEWHNWAVEWTPEGVTTFLDGEEWWKTTDTSILPPGPMHLCIQLDWFPEGKDDGQSGEMNVDWVKQYSLDEGEGSSTDSEGSEGSTDSDSSTSLTDEQNSKG